MIDLKSYTAFIESNIQRLEFPTEPTGLYDPIRYFLTIGGKRIRPILTLLGAELFGTEKEKVVSQAMAVEVFHNFTLIHDDIMDEAPLRRNRETVHEKWNTNIGILSGDVMLIHAYQLLSDFEPNKLAEALALFNKTAIEVCEGQQLDMDFEERNDVTIHEYIEMIRLKTSVLLGAALKLGAIAADANDEDQQALYIFGEQIGLAFQIQDDILDLYADPEKFGKQVGGDVIANKKTILYLTALNKASKEQHEVLRQLEQEKNIELKVTRTRELFDHLEIKAECQTRMEHHYTLAKEAIAKIEVPAANKEALISLARFLIEREL